MAKAYSPVRTGVDPRKESGGNGEKTGSWFKIRAGEVVDVVVLVESEEIIAVEQCAIWLEDGNSPVWVYTGPEDPSHDLGVDRAYRAYLPLLVDGEVQVWGMSKTVHRTILDIADASGELKGLELRVKRTGSGLATRYSVVPKGKRRDVSRIEEVDVIAMLGPITPEGVREYLTKKFDLDSYDEVVERYAGKRGGVSRRSTEAEAEEKPAKKKAKAPVVEDEDEIDDLEL